MNSPDRASLIIGSIDNSNLRRVVSDVATDEVDVVSSPPKTVVGTIYPTNGYGSIIDLGSPNYTRQLWAVDTTYFFGSGYHGADNNSDFAILPGMYLPSASTAVVELQIFESPSIPRTEENHRQLPEDVVAVGVWSGRLTFVTKRIEDDNRLCTTKWYEVYKSSSLPSEFAVGVRTASGTTLGPVTNNYTAAGPPATPEFSIDYLGPNQYVVGGYQVTTQLTNA